MNCLASTESLSPLLREITNTRWVARTFSLRFEVWNAETTLRPQVREQQLIADEHDARARHWAAFCGDEVVAAARMCIHQNQAESPDAPAFSEICLPVPVATVNRLVVHPSLRNRGLGSKLCKFRIEAAKQDGAKCVVGTFTEERIASLEKFGFRLTGHRWTPNHAESLVAYAMVLKF
jgi:GNAT superfamily N-acetyltransferase